MRCYFDESGDFAFPADRFDCYVQAGVVCPDSFEPALAAYVGGRRKRWTSSELHASELTAGQRLHVCRFIAGSPLELVAQATDTELVDRPALSRWRTAQAGVTERNLATYRSQGGASPEVGPWMDSLTKRSRLASRVSDVEYVQYMLLIDLTFMALQKSVVWFIDRKWAPDFHDFRFVYDGKLPRKLGAGEKLLRDTLVPILGSNARFVLTTADLWKNQDPPHPFRRYESQGGWAMGRHVEGDVLDLNLIFEHGLEFKDSKHEPGLQIADTVAYVVRRAVMAPGDAQAQLAYDLIRPRLRYREGRALQLARLDTKEVSRGSSERYRRLHWA